MLRIVRERRMLALVTATLIATVAFVAILAVSAVPHMRPSVDGVITASQDAPTAGGLPAAPGTQAPTEMAARSRAQASSVLGSVDARRATAAQALIASTEGRPKPPKGTDPLLPVGWRLSGPKVLSEGTTVRMPQGTLVRGRVVTASAKARIDGKDVERTFRVTFDVFSPSRSQAPQGTRPGMWYLNGLWQLTPSGQPSARRSLYAVRGHISGEYEFDPLESSGTDLHADVDVLGTPVTGVSAARKGEYAGSKDFDGALVLPEGQDLKVLASQLTGDSR